ncbi:8140_t:CDS:2, partial [Ambispora leptoticha]
MSKLNVLIVLLAVFVLAISPIFTSGTLVPFDSCASSDATYNVSKVDSVFDPSSNTLNFTITGYSSTKIAGYNSQFNATAFITTSVLNTKINNIKENLCASIDGNCPFGPGLVVIRKSIQLGQQIPLSTLTTTFKALDENIGQVTCLTFDISPQYQYFRPIFTYIPVSITAFTLFVNVLASFFNPTKFSTNIFEISSYYGLDPQGYRLRAPSVFDVIFYTQFAVSTAELGLNYPGYYQPFMSHFGWASLVFNHSTLINFSNGARPFLDDNAEPMFVDDALLSNATNNLTATPTPKNQKRNMIFHDIKKRQGNPQCSSSNPCPSGQCCSPAGFCGTGPSYCDNTVTTVTSTRTYLPTATDSTSPSATYLPDNFKVYDNTSSIMEKFKGMGNYAVMVGIAPQDIFLETIILALIIIAIVALISAIIWGIWGLMKNKSQNKPLGSSDQDQGLSFLLGNMLRFFLLFYFPMLSTAFYQLIIYQYVPWYAIAIAAVVIIACVVVPIVVTVLIYRVSPPVYLLNDLSYRLKYGPLYNTLKERGPMFFIIFLIYNFIRGVIVGAGQESGLTQAVVLMILELTLVIILISRLPFLEGTRNNQINVILGIIRTFISGFLLLFIGSLGISGVSQQIVGYIIIFFHGLAYTIFTLYTMKNLFGLIFRWCGFDGNSLSDSNDNNRSSTLRGSIGAAGGIRELKSRMGFYNNSNYYSERDNGNGPNKESINGGSILKAYRGSYMPPATTGGTGAARLDSFPSVNDDYENYTDESSGTPTGTSYADPNLLISAYPGGGDQYRQPPSRTTVIRNVNTARAQGSIGSSLGFEERGYTSSDPNISLAYRDATNPYLNNMNSDPIQAPSTDTRNQPGNQNSNDDDLFHARNDSAGSGQLGGPSTNNTSINSSNYDQLRAGMTPSPAEPPQRFLGNIPETRLASDESSNNLGGFLFSGVRKLFKKNKKKKGPKDTPSFWVKRTGTARTTASITDSELERAVQATQGRGKLIVLNPDPAGHSEFGDSVVDLTTSSMVGGATSGDGGNASNIINPVATTTTNTNNINDQITTTSTSLSESRNLTGFGAGNISSSLTPLQIQQISQQRISEEDEESKSSVYSIFEGSENGSDKFAKQLARDSTTDIEESGGVDGGSIEGNDDGGSSPMDLVLRKLRDSK